jgi:UDP:flavonoid glycosyltransferase YjiC (YdhE family)
MKLPDNVRVERFVSYHHLLPRLDVMITNGGYNGVNAALASGVPLVVAPGSEEKSEVATRVAWTGAGVAMPRKRLSEAAIRSAVCQVLDNPSYRRAALALRQEHHSFDAPVKSVDLIEQLVGTGHASVTERADESPNRAPRPNL